MTHPLVADRPVSVDWTLAGFHVSDLEELMTCNHHHYDYIIKS